MAPPDERLVALAQAELPSDHVVAACVVGIQYDYLAITAAGAATGLAASAVTDSPLVDGAVAGATVHGVQAARAAGKAVTARMLIAVTESDIVFMALPAVSDTPERELVRFPRRSTTVTVKRFGASRHITLANSETGQELEVASSVGLFSRYAEGTKSVLATLDHA